MNKKNIVEKLHYLLWYFIIFSVIGLIIETLYGFATMGIIESRKGLIYGPFCPIYGVGGALLILVLDKYRNNKTYPKKCFLCWLTQILSLLLAGT